MRITTTFLFLLLNAAVAQEPGKIIAPPEAEPPPQTGNFRNEFPDEDAKRKYLKELLANEKNFAGRLHALKALAAAPDLELFDDVMKMLHQRDHKTLNLLLDTDSDRELETLRNEIAFTIASYGQLVPGLGTRLLKEIEKGENIEGANPKGVAAMALSGAARTAEFNEIFRVFKGAGATNRLLNRGLAETLGGLSEFLREPQRTEVMKSLTEYLGKDDPAHRIGQRVLRGKLPREMVKAIDTELDQRAAAAYPNVNLCDTICGIFDKADEWGGNANTTTPEGYVDRNKPDIFWKGATRSLKPLFLESARPFCEKDPKPDKKLLDEFETLANQIREERLERAARIAAAKDSVQLKVEDLEIRNMTEKEKKTLVDFLNLAHGSGTWLPLNSIEAYGNVFASLLARNLKQSGLEFGSQGGLTPDEIGNIMQMPVEIGEKASSLGTTHLVASALVAAVPKTPEERRKIEKILAMLEANRVAAADSAKRNGVAEAEAKHHFPYGARIMDHDEHPEASRARGPLVRLAFYLHDRTNRHESRANLMEASDFFVQDFAKIFGTIGDDPYETSHFHDLKDHSRAAYYASSNVLYVAAGLELAQRDPKATPEQKAKAASVQATLRRRLLRQIQNGLFKPQNPKSFPFAAAYDNPHVGLAFLSQLDPKRDKCRSGKAAEPTTGVVDAAVVERRFETGAAPAAFVQPSVLKGNH